MPNGASRFHDLTQALLADLPARTVLPPITVFKSTIRVVFTMGPDRVWDRIRAKAVTAGVKPIPFHDMRHSYASILLNQGFSAEKVARWLGHGDTRLVSKV